MPAPKRGKRTTQRKARQNERYRFGRPKTVVTPKMQQRRASAERRREKQGKKGGEEKKEIPHNATIVRIADILEQEHGVKIERTCFANGQNYLQLQLNNGRQMMLNMSDPEQVAGQLKTVLAALRKQN